jgi:hypothetical protein
MRIGCGLSATNQASYIAYWLTIVSTCSTSRVETSGCAAGVGYQTLNETENISDGEVLHLVSPVPNKATFRRVKIGTRNVALNS